MFSGGGVGKSALTVQFVHDMFGKPIIYHPERKKKNEKHFPFFPCYTFTLKLIGFSHNDCSAMVRVYSVERYDPTVIIDNSS
jgi:GTPase SAR1 family protein